MEIWKEIAGQENRYLVSNLGNVKGLDRESVKTYLGVITGTVKVNGVTLKNRLNKSNYFVVDVTKKNMNIHRLVANAFIPNPENKPCINHINGIKTDNRVENLEWVTIKENVRHAWSSGLCLPRVGEKNNMAKLTENIVIDIRNSKESASSLAKKYDVDRSLIYLLRKNKIWKHI
jgi:hypothetical protein